MLLLLSFLWAFPSDENVKVEEDGSSDWGSWAVAMEVKRRVWIWDWDENVVRNFGFLLMEFKVLIISEFAIELGFCFLCSGFCWKSVLVVDGVFDYFYFPKTLSAFAEEFCSWKSFGLVSQLRVWACLDIVFGFNFM